MAAIKVDQHWLTNQQPPTADATWVIP